MEKVNWNRIFRIAILIGIAIYYLYREFKPTTTGNEQADTELETDKTKRPKTGELDFEK